MGKITVYRVQFCAARNVVTVRSRRWFTREGAERAKAEILESTAVEIEEADLNGERWTPRDYNPDASAGSQHQVR
jgi:hypothetical protein